MPIPAAPPSPRPWRPSRLHILAGLVVFAICLALFEIAAQVYARAVIFPGFDSIMANPRHYYGPSPSSVLAYELKPGVALEQDGRLLRINRWAIRDASDDLAKSQWRLAVLGDSVVFGVDHGDDRTITRLLQHEIDPDANRIRVFNFGLGGLNLAELVEYLRLKDEIYDVNEVIYLLNLNDLARRECMYEGADNGLYRMYWRPSWMGRFFVRKAIYRFVKDGLGAVPWYRWMFSGNEEWAYDQLRRMNAYARENGIRFSVVLLPAGSAFSEAGYGFADINHKIGALLARESIAYLDPSEVFASDFATDFDETDHFHDSGNLKMARVMKDFLLAMDVEW
jgi:hypothetical protein